MAAKNDNVMNSMIGEGSVFEGRFYIDGSLKIDGRFQGEVRTRDQLIVGENGRVKTDITARRVQIAGTVIGNIEAEEEVHLLGTGRLLGNIRAPRVRIEEGVVMQGEVFITGGERKEPRSAIEESFETGLKLEDLAPEQASREDTGVRVGNA
ncbi:MAG: bactofilin family protein [Spirochaetota bacterium]